MHKQKNSRQNIWWKKNHAISFSENEKHVSMWCAQKPIINLEWRWNRQSAIELSSLRRTYSEEVILVCQASVYCVNWLYGERILRVEPSSGKNLWAAESKTMTINKHIIIVMQNIDNGYESKCKSGTKRNGRYLLDLECAPLCSLFVYCSWQLDFLWLWQSSSFYEIESQFLLSFTLS